MQAAALWRHERGAAARRPSSRRSAPSSIRCCPSLSGWLLENGAFATTWSIVLTYWIALAVVSAAVLALVLSLLHRPEPAGPGLPRLLLQWSYGFAGVCALAFPVFTQDLWLSAVWGRMIAAGVNPFHTLFTPELLVGLPLDHFPMPMSYGPLWGLVSAASHAGRRRAASSWPSCSSRRCSPPPGSAPCTSSAASPRACRRSRRCLAILLFGWAPAGVSQSLAEGHNDIAMVALALLWLYRLHARPAGRRRLPWPRPALCKYVTAPLCVIDALYALGPEKIGWGRYALRLAPAAALGLATMALFYRSSEFFDGVRLVGTWYFLQPRDAVQAVELALGVSLLPLALAVTALFPVYAAARTARRSGAAVRSRTCTGPMRPARSAPCIRPRMSWSSQSRASATMAMSLWPSASDCDTPAGVQPNTTMARQRWLCGMSSVSR